MRIAHIVCTFPPYKGGMGNSVYHMATQIGSRGHKSVVFTPAYNKENVGEENLGWGTKVVRLKPLLAVGNAAILPQLLWRLKDFDIINLHYPFFGSAILVALAAFFGRTKLVVHYHMDTVSSGIKGLIFWFYSFFFLPVLVRLTKTITCASLDYIRQSQLSDYYVHHFQKFIEIPFGVNADLFVPGSEEREPIILFVGALDQQHYFKGVKELIEAFSLIASKRPEARLVLVGHGDLENHYQDLADSHHLEEKFTMITKASDTDLAKWYGRARVSVLPSINKSEAFGLVLLEAMSSATPVIASNLPGVRNVFRNKEHGFLVQPGDVNQLAEKLAFMLDNPEAARLMGERARAWIEQRYSWVVVGERLEATYLRIFYSLKNQYEDSSD